MSELAVLRELLADAIARVEALDSAEKREGWLAAETPEPPSTRKPKATRRAPSR